MNKNIQTLYNNLSKDYDLPDFATFAKDMKDSAKLKELHKNLSADYDLPDFATFARDMADTPTWKPDTRTFGTGTLPTAKAPVAAPIHDNYLAPGVAETIRQKETPLTKEDAARMRMNSNAAVEGTGKMLDKLPIKIKPYKGAPQNYYDGEAKGVEAAVKQNIEAYLQNPFEQFSAIVADPTQELNQDKVYMDGLFAQLSPQEQYEAWKADKERWSNHPAMKNLKSVNDDESGFWQSGLGNAIQKLDAGAASTFGGMANWMHREIEKPLWGWMAKDPNSRMIWGRITDHFNEEAAHQSSAGEMRENLTFDKNGQARKKDFADYFAEGNWYKGIGDMVLGGVESAPNSVMPILATMAGMPQVGMAAMMTSVTGNRYAELDRDHPEMSEAQKTLVAHGSGAIEVLTERMGDIPIGKMLGKMYGKGGAAVFNKTLNNSAESIIEQMGKEMRSAKHIFWKAPVGEGGEELFSGIGNYLLDSAFGLQQFNMKDMLTDSGKQAVYGFVSGTGFGAMGAKGAMRNEKMARQLDAMAEQYKQADGEMLTMRLRYPGVKFEGEKILSMPIAAQEDILNIAMNSNNIPADYKKAIREYLQVGNNLNAALVNLGVEKIELLRKQAAAFKQTNEQVNEETGKISYIKLRGSEKESAPVLVKSGKVNSEKEAKEAQEPVYYYTGETNEDGTPEVLIAAADEIEEAYEQDPEYVLQQRLHDIEAEEFVRSEFGVGMRIVQQDDPSAVAFTVKAFTPTGLEVTLDDGSTFEIPFKQAVEMDVAEAGETDAEASAEPSGAGSETNTQSPSTVIAEYALGSANADGSLRVRGKTPEGDYLIEDAAGNLIDRFTPKEMPTYGFTAEAATPSEAEATTPSEAERTPEAIEADRKREIEQEFSDIISLYPEEANRLETLLTELIQQSEKSLAEGSAEDYDRKMLARNRERLEKLREINSRYDNEMMRISETENRVAETAAEASTPQQDAPSTEATSEPSAEQPDAEAAARAEFYASLPVIEKGDEAGLPDTKQMTPEQTVRYFDYEYGQEDTDKTLKAQIEILQKEVSRTVKASEQDPFNIGKKNKARKATETLNAYKEILAARQIQALKNASEERQAVGTQMREQMSAQSAQMNKQQVAANLDEVAANWNDAQKVAGWEDTFTKPNGETIQGRWILAEATSATPSHDPNTMASNPAFEIEGKNINDNDYATKRHEVESKAQSFDTRAIDNPIVVYQGAVVSGNNRTMSRQLAAQMGTDKQYLRGLREKLKKYGIDAAEMENFEHPTLYFEASTPVEFSTKAYGEFNQRETKSKSATEKAVIASKRNDAALIGRITDVMNTFDTLQAFYASEKAQTEVLKMLVESGTVHPNDVAELFENNNFTPAGKDFLESTLLGNIVKEDQIKMLNSIKSLRAKIVGSFIPLLENKGKSAESIIAELNEAVRYIYEANAGGMSLFEYFSKQDMFKHQEIDLNAVSLAVALQRDGFRKFVADVNGKLNGVIDIFTGRPTSKQDILANLNDTFNQEERAIYETARRKHKGQGRSGLDTSAATDSAGAIQRGGNGDTQTSGTDAGETSTQGEVETPRRSEATLRELFDSATDIAARKAIATQILAEVQSKLPNAAQHRIGNTAEFLESLSSRPESLKQAKEVLARGKHIPGVFLGNKIGVFINIEQISSYEQLIKTYLHEQTHSVNARKFTREETQGLVDNAEQYIPKDYHNQPAHVKADEAIAHETERLLKDNSIEDILDGNANYDGMTEETRPLVEQTINFLRNNENNQDRQQTGLRGSERKNEPNTEAHSQLRGRGREAARDVSGAGIGRVHSEVVDGDNRGRTGSATESDKRRNTSPDSGSRRTPINLAELAQQKVAEKETDDAIDDFLSLLGESREKKDSEPLFKITNSNTNFVEDEKTKYYTDSQGKKIPFKVFTPNGNRWGDNLLQWEKGKKHQADDFALVERQFSEYKQLDFTAGTKIESLNDIAWLFRNLEDEAVEHCFVTYIMPDGSYVVQHLGTGGFTGAVADGRLMAGNAIKMGAASVAFVHNHPSGNLKASAGDKEVHARLQKGLKDTGIDLQEGIIINLRSGKYLSFNSYSESISSRSEQQQQQREIPVLSFSKQVFAENYNPDRIGSSADVARLLSTKKFGISDKTEMLVLNQQNEVVGKFVLPEKNQYNKIVELLTQYGGTSTIIYGNKINGNKISEYNSKLKSLQFQILDAIEVQSDNYKSLADKGLLGEPASDYGEDVRFKIVDDQRTVDKLENSVTAGVLRELEKLGASIDYEKNNPENVRFSIAEDTNSPEYRAKIFAAGEKLITNLVKSGNVKFKDVADYMQSKGVSMNDNILNALKSAYASFYVSHPEVEGLDDISAVRAVKLEDVKSNQSEPSLESAKPSEQESISEIETQVAKNKDIPEIQPKESEQKSKSVEETDLQKGEETTPISLAELAKQQHESNEKVMGEAKETQVDRTKTELTNDRKDNEQTPEKTSKTKKLEKKDVSSHQTMDMFGDLPDEQPVTQKDQRDEQLQRNDGVRSERLSADGNKGKQPTGRLGEATREESNGLDQRRNRGGSQGLGYGLQQSERLDGRLSPKNSNNNHSERGQNHAPNSVDARIDANIKAIEIAHQLIENGENATPEQMAELRKFSGWGGLGKAFSDRFYSARIQQLLGTESYQQAVMSANSAYYTPAYVVDTLWDIAERMGFKGGNILEGSAGIGNVIGQIPTHLNKQSDIHAIEIDSTSGGILSLLYPDAKVEIQGFEQTRIPNGSIDLAITNVPFVTGLRVNDTTGDKDLSKKFHNIHDFCIAKNVRKLRDGGIGIFISSNGTLDNSKKLRDWVTNEGGSDFVGAFRMNNKTFGGTSVTSDIIVIRKRVNGQRSANAIDTSSISGERMAEYDTGETRKIQGRQVPIVKQLSMDYNRYFIEHPENMAGEMHFAFEQGDTFRPTSKGLYPAQGKNQEKMLSEFVESFANMQGERTQSEESSHNPRGYVSDVSADGKKMGEVYVKDGKLVVAGLGGYYPLEVNANKVKGHTKVECFNAYAAIKDALADVLSYQTENESNKELQPLLDKLNKVYDDFVKIYGHFNKNTSISFLRNDVDFPNVFSLEKYEEIGDESGNRVQKFEKTDVFRQRVIEKEKEPTPTNVKDGIVASIFKFGRIDLSYISDQLGKSIDSIKQEIIEFGFGFEEPVTRQMELSYQYLSGNVREKLRQAQENNEKGEYDRNIQALQDIIPMDIPGHLIDFTLGSSWIEPNLYSDYVKERTDIEVKFTAAGGTWYMDAPTWGLNKEQNRSMGVYSEMLHKTIYGHTLMEAAIQNKTVTVSQTNKKWDGTTETITDKDATQACAAKIDEIRQDFKEWARGKMQSDAEMSARMERVYNDTFNNYVPISIPDDFAPEYFGGASHKFKMRPHQSKSIVRGTMQSLLLAHEVGTGKTFTLISTAMEMRRLGTARKPMIVVQNATVGQFVASAKELYPNAKILTLEESDRSAEGRMNFYAKIRYNDWDMIVVPQSTFEFIPDSEERQMAFVQDKIEEKMLVLEQMKNVDPDGNSIITRQAEKEIELLQDQLAGLSDEASKKRTASDEKKRAVSLQNAEVKSLEMLDRKTDAVENFDDMGIDALLIDEAHEYKHLGFATAMQRGVKGVDPSYSKKSQGVYLKTQAILEKNNGRNVIFATGTPISNTAAEIWTFMRYLMPADTMKEYGIYYFDDFARNFGNIQQMLEFTTSGKFKENNRFAGYVNLPELVRIWSGVSDTVLTKEAGGVSDKIPELEEGKVQDLYLPQTRALRSIMKFVKSQLEEYEKMSGKDKKANSHIPLTMYGIAKAAAVDARLVSTEAEDDANSKTNEAVRQTLRSLKDADSYKGTVAIFADNYQNKHSGFNLYEDIREKLIAGGVPIEQIVVMKSGMTVKKKLEIFDKVNRGEVRVVLGSTFTLGTGVNIQERLHTLIHLDAPNRPMDYTQRNGRILRQGNLHKTMGKPVRVLRFGVEDSLDVTAYQRLKTKGAIADSVMSGKQMMVNSMSNRVLEEEEDMFGDTIAQLSGSEYAMLKNNVEKNVRKLESRKKQWEADQTYIHNAKPRLKGQVVEAERSIEKQNERLQTLQTVFPNRTFKSITAGKQTFSTIEGMADFIKAYNKSILDEVKKMKDSGVSMDKQTRELAISFDGIHFKIKNVLSKEMNMGGGQLFAEVHRKMTYSCPELELEDVPVHQSLLRNAIEDIAENVITGKDFIENSASAERSIKHKRSELEQLQSRDGKPFEYDKELAQAKSQLSEYTEMMKKEMQEKEAKYAEIDSTIEEANRLDAIDDEDTGGEAMFKIVDNIEAERSVIKEKAIADGTFMKAPNGKPTKLNEAQWVDVRTKNFIDWFGDWQNDPASASKVVDENGEPMVVYHGTNEEFTEFRDEITEGTSTRIANGYGYFFTPSSEIAHRFGERVMPVFLNIREPKKIGKGKQISFKKKWFGADKLLRQASRSEVAAAGHDGFYLPNISFVESKIVKNTPQYVAFRPNQIKSATDNTGEYSGEREDIRFSITDSGTTPANIAEHAAAVNSANRAKHDPAGSVEEMNYRQDAAQLEQINKRIEQLEADHASGKTSKAIYEREKAAAQSRAAMLKEQMARYEQWLDEQDEQAENDPRPTMEAGESIQDFATRMQAWRERQASLAIGTQIVAGNNISGIGTAPEDDGKLELLRAELDDRIGGFLGRVMEGYQDNIRSVRIFLDLLRENGLRISDYNNYYQQYTAIQGKNDAHLKDFGERYVKPISKSIRNILTGTKYSYRDVENYVMAKHGIERNAYMREQAAKEAEANDKTPRLRDDYSGLYVIAAEYWAREQGLIYDPKSQKQIDSILKDKEFVKDRDRVIADFIREFERIAFGGNVKGVEKGATLTADEFWGNLRKASHYTLDRLVESGIEDKAEIDDLKSRYNYYVPLRGHEIEAEKRWYYEPPAAENKVSKAIMQASGRSTRAEHPFAYIVQTAQTSINKANRNTLNQTLLRLARMDKSGLMSISEAWYTITGIDPDTQQNIWEVAEPDFDENKRIDAEDIRAWNEQMRLLEEQGYAQRRRKGLDVGRMFIKPKQRKQHAISIFEDGVEYQVYINANPRVSQAVNELNQSSVHIPAITPMTRFISGMVTSRSPQFMLVNGARDFLFANTMLGIKESGGYQLSFLKHYPIAMATLTNSETLDAGGENKYKAYLREFEMNGGETGYSHLLELRDIQRELEKDMKGRDMKNPMTTGAKLIEVIDRTNRIVENTTRLATYMASREAGRSIERSVSDSKEVTLNFNRRGSGAMGAKYVQSVFMFVNAGVQALATTYKAFKGNKVKAAASISMYASLGFMMPILSKLLSGDGDDDEYMNLTDYERQNNLCISLGSGHGYIKLPLPQEMRVMYKLGDLLHQVYMGDIGKTDACIETLKGAMDLIPISPLGAVASGEVSDLKDAIRIFTPDAIAPVMQLGFNRNFMGSRVYDEYKSGSGQPGYRQALVNRVGEPRVNAGMYQFSKWLDGVTGGDGTVAGYLSINPDKANQLMSGYFGGIYNLITDGADSFSRRFYTSEANLEAKKTRISGYFDTLDEAKEATRRYKEYTRRHAAGELTDAEYKSKIDEPVAVAANQIQRLKAQDDKISKLLKSDELNEADKSAYMRQSDAIRREIIRIWTTQKKK